MKKYLVNSFFCIVFFLGVTANCAVADLSKVLAEKGAKGVAKVVKVAASEAYAKYDKNLKSYLIELLNNVEKIKDDESMRYAIVSVVMAGGSEHLDLSKEVVVGSNIFAENPKLALSAFELAESLLKSDSNGGGGQPLPGKEWGRNATLQRQGAIEDEDRYISGIDLYNVIYGKSEGLVYDTSKIPDGTYFGGSLIVKNGVGTVNNWPLFLRRSRMNCDNYILLE